MTETMKILSASIWLPSRVASRCQINPTPTKSTAHLPNCNHNSRKTYVKQPNHLSWSVKGMTNAKLLCAEENFFSACICLRRTAKICWYDNMYRPLRNVYVNFFALPIVRCLRTHQRSIRCWPRQQDASSFSRVSGKAHLSIHAPSYVICVKAAVCFSVIAFLCWDGWVYSHNSWRWKWGRFEWNPFRAGDITNQSQLNCSFFKLAFYLSSFASPNGVFCMLDRHWTYVEKRFGFMSRCVLAFYFAWMNLLARTVLGSDATRSNYIVSRSAKTYENVHSKLLYSR